MKAIAKTLTLVILFTFFENNVAAQVPNYSDETLKNVEKMSIQSMDSDMNSLVESVIFNMVAFKVYRPDWDFDEILTKLNDLSLNGNSVTIRYKAQLASLFISHYSMFDSVIANNTAEFFKLGSAEFFKLVADRFQHEMVAVN